MQIRSEDIERLAQERCESFVAAVENRPIDGTDDRIIIALSQMSDEKLIAMPLTAAEPVIVYDVIRREGYERRLIHTDLCEFYKEEYLGRLGLAHAIWSDSILFGYAEKFASSMGSVANYKVRISDGVALSVRNLHSNGVTEPQRKVEAALDVLRQMLGDSITLDVSELAKVVSLQPTLRT